MPFYRNLGNFTPMDAVPPPSGAVPPSRGPCLLMILNIRPVSRDVPPPSQREPRTGGRNIEQETEVAEAESIPRIPQ